MGAGGPVITFTTDAKTNGGANGGANLITDSTSHTITIPMLSLRTLK